MSQKNRYQHRTPRLGIPVPGHLDGIWPAVEMKKWTIVENMLIGGLKGAQNCVFGEGNFSMKGNTVILQASERSLSVEGIVGGCYFKAPPRVEWKVPPKTPSCLLYIKGLGKTREDPAAVRSVVSSIRLKDAVLVAAIEKGVLNVRPTGKMVVGEPPPSETVDFKTRKKGVVLKSRWPVSFVQVGRTSREGGSMGEVSVGYFGMDERAETPENFVVYNDGDAGISARALIL